MRTWRGARSASTGRSLFFGVFALAMMLLLAACGGGTQGGDTGGEGGGGEAEVQPPGNLLTADTLTVGIDATYPPYEYVEGDEFRGFDVDLSRRLAELMGLDVKYVDTRFTSLIPGLQARKYDVIISAVYITEERARTVDYVPYFNAGLGFIVSADTDFRPQAYEDLCDRTVAVLQASVNEEIAQNDIAPLCEQQGQEFSFVSFPTDTEAAQEVAAGRADVLFTDNSVGTFRAEELPQLNLTVSNTTLIAPSPVGIVVPEEGSEGLKRALQQGLDRLNQSGEFQELLDQYGMEPIDLALAEEALAGED